MKKILTTIALLLAATALSAQEVVEIIDIQSQKPSNRGFVTNGFWDNWEITAAAGAQTFIKNGWGKDYGKRGKSITAIYELSLNKWLTPVFGARVQGQGFQIHTFRANRAKDNWSYYFIHTDVMANLSNWIGGYREDRVYYAVLFGGFGYARSHITNGKHVQELAVTGGLINRFRVARWMDINLELKAVGMNETFDGRGHRGKAGILSASVGVTYRFNNRTFHRPVPPIIPDYSPYVNRINTLENNLASARSENGKLQSELRQVQTTIRNTREEVVRYKDEEVPVAGAVFFQIGQARLYPQADIDLDYLAAMIKSTPERNYTVIGYADRETGTARRNEQLSQERAQAVYKALVERGVKASQLKTDWKGSTVQPFNGAPQNRVVVIER